MTETAPTAGHSRTDGYGVAWELRLLSFAGVVGWATHWQAKLRGRVEDVEVAYVMSAEDARALSSKDFTERPGEPTTRFRSRNAASAAAIAAWRSLAAPRDVLVSEFGARVLAGPEDLLNEGAVAAADEDVWFAWVSLFAPHEHDTRFGKGAPPSVRRSSEVVTQLVDGEWRVAS